MGLLADLKKWQAAKSRKKRVSQGVARAAKRKAEVKPPLYDSKWDDPVLEGMIRGNGAYLSASLPIEPIRGRNSFEMPTLTPDSELNKKQLEYLEKMVRQASGITVTY